MRPSGTTVVLMFDGRLGGGSGASFVVVLGSSWRTVTVGAISVVQTARTEVAEVGHVVLQTCRGGEGTDDSWMGSSKFLSTEGEVVVRWNESYMVIAGDSIGSPFKNGIRIMISALSSFQSWRS